MNGFKVPWCNNTKVGFGDTNPKVCSNSWNSLQFQHRHLPKSHSSRENLSQGGGWLLTCSMVQRFLKHGSAICLVPVFFWGGLNIIQFFEGWKALDGNKNRLTVGYVVLSLVTPTYNRHREGLTGMKSHIYNQGFPPFTGIIFSLPYSFKGKMSNGIFHCTKFFPQNPGPPVFFLRLFYE